MDDWWLMMNDDGGWWMTMNDDGWCRWWWMMMHDADCASWSGILETISPCDQKNQNDCMKQLSVWSYHLFADLHASKTLIIFSNDDISIYIYIYTNDMMNFENCAVVMTIGPQPKFRTFDLLHFVVGTSLEFFVGFPGRCRRGLLAFRALRRGLSASIAWGGMKGRGRGDDMVNQGIWITQVHSKKSTGNHDNHDVSNHLRILALTLPHHHSNMLNVKNEYMAEWWSGFHVLRNFINFLGQVSHKPIRKCCY